MPSATQLLIVLAVVILVFGTGKIKQLGSDLGGAVKGFKKGFQTEDGEDVDVLSEMRGMAKEVRHTVEGISEVGSEIKAAVPTRSRTRSTHG